jgi:hypothetical protein
MSEHRTSEELKAIEATLGSLVPQQGGLDRDRLMYRAGAASVDGRSARWMWPAATAAMTLLSATLAISLAGRSEPRVVERIKYVPGDGPTTTTRDPSPPRVSMDRDGRMAVKASSGNYLRLRRLVLAGGVEALPPPPRRGDGSVRSGPVTSRGSLLKQLRES